MYADSADLEARAVVEVVCLCRELTACEVHLTLAQSGMHPSNQRWLALRDNTTHGGTSRALALPPPQPASHSPGHHHDDASAWRWLAAFGFEAGGSHAETAVATAIEYEVGRREAAHRREMEQSSAVHAAALAQALTGAAEQQQRALAARDAQHERSLRATDGERQRACAMAEERLGSLQAAQAEREALQAEVARAKAESDSARAELRGLRAEARAVQSRHSRERSASETAVLATRKESAALRAQLRQAHADLQRLQEAKLVAERAATPLVPAAQLAAQFSHWREVRWPGGVRGHPKRAPMRRNARPRAPASPQGETQ